MKKTWHNTLFTIILLYNIKMDRERREEREGQVGKEERNGNGDGRG